MMDFWLLFWSAFVLLPILFLISRLFKSSGKATDTSHHWALGSSNAKYRSATVRDVWEKTHRDRKRSWEENQELKANIIFGVLALALVGAFILASDSKGLDILKIIGAVLAGGGAAYGFFTSLYKALNLETGEQYDSLIPPTMAIASALALLVLLVLTAIRAFGDKPLLFSIHFLWIPLALGPLAWLLRIYLQAAEVQKQNQDRIAHEQMMINPDLYPETDPLSPWAAQMYQEWKRFDGGVYIAENDYMYIETAKRVEELIENGYLSADNFSGSFFRATERLLLALVSGTQIAISVNSVYYAREELIKTAQMVYIHMANNNVLYNIHPTILRALNG